jgi:diacylglycerol kinase (ATP)
MPRPSCCVIYNPAAGRGRLRRQIDRLRRRLGDRADFWPTREPGHAEELAGQAARQGYAVVAAAGGDGTVHEVAAGVILSGVSDTTFATLPAGSANDYAHSLGLGADWWAHPDPAVGPRLVDVGILRSGSRLRPFVNGMGFGFNGAVTVESRRIKHLRGLALYGLAFLRSVVSHFRCPPTRVRIDAAAEREAPTLGFSLALGRREGNFVVAPHALLDDGLFDYLHVGALTRWDLVRFLPVLALGRTPQHPQLWRGRCRRLHVTCAAPLTVHLDGELFSLPTDNVHELDVEIRPGGLRVLGRQGGAFAQSPGPEVATPGLVSPHSAALTRNATAASVRS